MTEQTDADARHQITQLRERLDWIEQTIFTVVTGAAALGLIGALLLPFWSLETIDDQDALESDNVWLLGLPSSLGKIASAVQGLTGTEGHEAQVSTLPIALIVASMITIVATLVAIVRCGIGRTRQFHSWHSILVTLCAAATALLWLLTWAYGNGAEDFVNLANVGLKALTFGSVMALLWAQLSRGQRALGTR